MRKTHRHRLVLLLAAALSGCATMGEAGAPVDGVEVGSRLPALKVTDFRGRALGPEVMAGRVLLLDIWAAWCPPCKEELPLLDAMAARLRSKGVSIVAVSIDENREDAMAFLRSQGRSWSLALAHDPEGRVAARLNPSKMPTSYVVDRSGVIRQVIAGFTPEDLAKIEAHLTRLAAESR